MRGSYTFTGRYSGNPLGDLLLGLPTQALRGLGRDGDTQFAFVSQAFRGFVQDDWRATDRLTMTLGLRHEYVIPTIDRRFLNQSSGFAAKLLEGWQVNGILTLKGGQPFTPVLAIDNSNTGQFQDRPNFIGDPYAPGPGCPETDGELLGQPRRVRTGACVHVRQRRSQLAYAGRGPGMWISRC